MSPPFPDPRLFVGRGRRPLLFHQKNVFHV